MRYVLTIFVGVSFLVILPFITRRSRRRTVKRMLREGKNLGVFGPQRISISPDWLSNASTVNQSITRWIGVERIVITPDAVFFYDSAVGAHLLPKRAFATDADFRHFVELAQEYQRRATV